MISLNHSRVRLLKNLKLLTRSCEMLYFFVGIGFSAYQLLSENLRYKRITIHMLWNGLGRLQYLIHALCHRYFVNGTAKPNTRECLDSKSCHICKASWDGWGYCCVSLGTLHVVATPSLGSPGYTIILNPMLWKLIQVITKIPAQPNPASPARPKYTC